jgi:deazaflavin-dependent oxidoreductase (nitroreductase family)
MTPMQKLARYLGRQPWLPTVGPRVVAVDIALQRLTRGRISFGGLAGLTALLLTTTGRKSGRPRTAPLIAVPDGDSLLVVGSNWGRPNHPAWSANLIANPAATVRVRGRDFPVTTAQLTGDERARAWTTVTTVWPVYDDYAAKTSRQLRIFRVTRR